MSIIAKKYTAAIDQGTTSTRFMIFDHAGQVVEWVQQLSPVAKQSVLRALIPRLDELEALVDYGGQRARALCAERGLDWDGLTEDERQQLVDELLYET